MKNNKNLWIGLGVIVVIIAIILAITLGGKKKEVVAPENTTPAPITTTKTTTSKKVVDTSVLKVTSPLAGSTLKRGAVAVIAWTGPAECYDLGYAFNPKGDTAFNFIAKVCKTSAGTFSYKWATPLNVVPGVYGLELRKSGSMEHGADVVSFLFK
jgi:hypothetical protein